MFKRRHAHKQVKLRDSVATCIFCAKQTPHVVIRSQEAHRYYGHSGFKTMEVCQQCGGYRLLPDEDGG